MKKDWNGILKIEELLIKRNEEIIYKVNDLYNILHTEGEAEILRALFIGGPTSNAYIPSLYYLGLDDRATLAASDTLATLSGEPSSGGYTRQPISSTTGFTLVESGSTVKAKSGVIIFSATGSSWGPVRNMFLTNVATGTSGILYSSIPIGSNVTVANGDDISLRFSMALKNC